MVEAGDQAVETIFVSLSLVTPLRCQNSNPVLAPVLPVRPETATIRKKRIKEKLERQLQSFSRYTQTQ